MPEQNGDALAEVLDDLAYTATQARLVGGSGDQLADEIERLVNRYRTGDAAVPVAFPATDMTAASADNSTGDVTDDGVLDDFDDFLADELDGLDDEALAAAMPHEIVLHVRRVDGFTLLAADALAAVNAVLPSLVAEVGDLTVGDCVPDKEEPSLVHVTLHGGLDSGLVRLGAGQDGFNAAFPLIGVGDVVVTSRVGDVEDAELAEALGLLPPQLPEQPEGKHAINGVLDLVEEAYGERPVAKSHFQVRYSKDSGNELTEDETRHVVNHPISAGPGGLRRFGQYTLLGVVDGDDASVKIAHFELLEAGEIDMATVALAATGYRGTFDFGGTIGAVSANAHAELVEVEVDA